MPKPPQDVGVNIILFDSLFLWPFINLMIILSISFLSCFEGRGKIVAMWVNLESRQVLVILTLAVDVSFMVDQAPISDLTALMAFSQFRSSLSSSPVRYMPRSLKGLGSRENPVLLAISGESFMLPNRAYFVFSTLVFRPDNFLNPLRILRISVSWDSGWVYWMNKLMSSVYASISFEWSD